MVESADKKEEKIIIKTIISTVFMENGYILSVPDGKECVVIDPGMSGRKFLDYFKKHNLIPTAILITHGHADHILGNSSLREAYPNLKIYIGEKDATKLTNPKENLSGIMGMGFTSPPADVKLQDGEKLSLAGMEIEVFHTPGHSAGHVVYLIRATSPYTLFSGDVLFHRGVGRTDFYDGDFETLKNSIQNKIYILPDSTVVYCGHDITTTVGEEKEKNPYVKAKISDSRK